MGDLPENVRIAIEAAQRAEDGQDLRLRAAREAGLPIGLADRLRGNDAAELLQDAKRLAIGIGVVDPEPAEDTEPDPAAEHTELLSRLLGGDD